MSLVFVFGSNSYGNHGAGAAKVAHEKYGAAMGVGHGLQGNSYAIDTMSGETALKRNVDTFLEFARSNPDMCFYVTPIGCGIAGYTAEFVAPLFADAPFNVALCTDLVKGLKRVMAQANMGGVGHER